LEHHDNNRGELAVVGISNGSSQVGLVVVAVALESRNGDKSAVIGLSGNSH
jgi:hypothetical protein